VANKGCELSLPSIKALIKDIAGIRITCSFISDIYVLSEMLCNQRDIKVIDCKDYIKNPKQNGYQSLHMILQIPVFMSDREELVNVEVQIRTIAMDFWASLEHKIYYKYNKEVPQNLVFELKEAATAAAALDRKMERLNKEISAFKQTNENSEDLFQLSINGDNSRLPLKLLESLTQHKMVLNQN
jgi:putative GTP pyrophosphokinase